MPARSATSRYRKIVIESLSIFFFSIPSASIFAPSTFGATVFGAAEADSTDTLSATPCPTNGRAFSMSTRASASEAEIRRNNKTKIFHQSFPLAAFVGFGSSAMRLWSDSRRSSMASASRVRGESAEFVADDPEPPAPPDRAADFPLGEPPS